MHRHGLGGSRGRRTLGSGLHGNCWRGSTRPRPRGYGAPACYARRPPNAGHRSNPLNGFDTGPAGCRRPVRRGSCARIPPSPGPVVLPSLCCRRWKPSVPNHRHPHPLFIGIRCATEHGGRMRSPTTMGGRCIKTPPCAVAAKGSRPRIKCVRGQARSVGAPPRCPGFPRSGPYKATTVPPRG